MKNRFHRYKLLNIITTKYAMLLVENVYSYYHYTNYTISIYVLLFKHF